MLQLVVVRPGATDFDEQGRIKGALDVPLNANGELQVARTAEEISQLDIDAVYSAPCEYAEQTARVLADPRQLKIRLVPSFRNLDHGLWEGKLIAEVKQNQPRVYRLWQEHPETICPPDGESVRSAQERVREALRKIARRHPRGVVALVVPEPLASIVEWCVEHRKIEDLWKVECSSGCWEMLEVASPKVLAGEW